MSEFCNVLKRLREEKGITQKEIAKILGISQAAYSLYEKGQREPKYEMLEKMADFFNVSVGFLVSGRKDYIYYVSKIPNYDEFFKPLNEKFYFYTEDEVVNNGNTLLKGEPQVKKELEILKQLFKSISNLNEEGQRKVKEYVDDLSANPKYLKDEDPDKNTDNSDK